MKRIAMKVCLSVVALLLAPLVLNLVLSANLYLVQEGENLDYMTLMAILFGFYYLLTPHPSSFASPRLHQERLKHANKWRESLLSQQELSQFKTGKRYAVIGAGFVGKKLIHHLLLRGETNIRVLDVNPNACDQFDKTRVEFIQGNVLDVDQVCRAVRDADVVFATFAVIRFMDSLPSQAKLSFDINVLGTECVIRACQQCRVSILIQTSTSNVSLSSKTCSLDMTEKIEYITREDSLNHYGWTKAIAEQLVLKANSPVLKTGAIRPCSAVFGAEDRHLLDGMLKLGRTALPHNGGRAVLDFVSVENVVHGHVLLEQALWRNTPGVDGQAFCVSNNQPMRMLDFVAMVHELRGEGGLVRIPTPEKLLVVISHVVEQLNRFGFHVPGQLGQLTATTVKFLELSYAFSSAKAYSSLGYKPLLTVEEGIQMSVEEWKQGKMLPELH